MGTDIHPVVQVRNLDRRTWEAGEWLDVKPPTKEVAEALDDRRYLLFAVLADVRNGFGFAGVTHEPLTPISKPRGFPEDFEIHDDYHHGNWKTKYWEPGDPLGKFMGDHSHSWVTLAELDAFDWQAQLQRGGMVHKDTPITADGKPKQWSGAVFGQHEAEYRRHEWTESIAACVGAFYTDALPWLRALGKPDAVRLVFGFDS